MKGGQKEVRMKEEIRDKSKRGKKICKITDQKMETPLFCVSHYDTPRTAGELGGGSWEASKSLSHCLPVCLLVGWLQVEHSLPLLLSK